MSYLHWTTEDGVKVFENERTLRVLYPMQLSTDTIAGAKAPPRESGG